MKKEYIFKGILVIARTINRKLDRGTFILVKTKYRD